MPSKGSIERNFGRELVNEAVGYTDGRARVNGRLRLNHGYIEITRRASATNLEVTTNRSRIRQQLHVIRRNIR